MNAKLPNPTTQSYWFQQLDYYLFLKLCLMLAYHQTQCSSYYQPLLRLNTPNSIQPSFFRSMEFFSEGFSPTWPKRPPFWMAHLNSVTPLQEASLTTQGGTYPPSLPTWSLFDNSWLAPVHHYPSWTLFDYSWWVLIIHNCPSWSLLDYLWHCHQQSLSYFSILMRM